MKISERTFNTLIILMILACLVLGGVVGAVVGTKAVRTETCTVTAKAENGFTAARGQSWEYLETTCGPLGVMMWPYPGHDIIEKLEVGKTYRFDIYGSAGSAHGWGRGTIFSYEEVAE